MKGKKKGSLYWKIILVQIALVILFGGLVRITSFSDFFVDHIFGRISGVYSRLTGVFPFSVGEGMLFLAGLAILLELFVFPVLMISLLRKKRILSDSFLSFARRYSKVFLCLFLLVVWIMILNCSSLYHTSKLNVKGHGNKTYSAEEIQIVRDYIANQCNELSVKMDRDDDGNVQITQDRQQCVLLAMKHLSEEYPRLSGYYPNPKPIQNSYIMYQAGCDGVYFPFTMEANYNRYISDIRYLHVACHELSHLKGYIYEDEADFLAFLACTESEDEAMQYAGYLAVFWYVNNDCEKVNGRENNGVLLRDEVYRDSGSYTSQRLAWLESKHTILSTQTVETASDGFTNSYMTYYDATPNYDEVTELILDYYDGILY